VSELAAQDGESPTMGSDMVMPMIMVVIVVVVVLRGGPLLARLATDRQQGEPRQGQQTDEEEE
jgi:hypothetical protein